MLNWLNKNKFSLLIILFIIVGLCVRVFLIDKVVVGDLMNYAEWGQRLAESGPKDFYFSKGWYYSIPVYPPVSMWVFSGLFWVSEHKFVLAQMHNLIKFPPSVFIIYFYKWSYIFLLKLLPIIADLGISIVVYKLIFEITKNKRKAVFGLLFYLLNPITIFLSGAWGQTDSVVAILGLVSFLLLINKKVWVSIPLLFLSIYFKPSWAILGPFYLFCLYIVKPKIREIVAGFAITLFLFIITTAPFSDNNVFIYGWKLFKERYPLPVGIDGKASISAFNFQTIFFKIDISYSHEKMLGVSSGIWGMVFYIFSNILAMINLRRQKDKLLGVISGIFIVGMGSFVFMATMLERYFFPALAPLIILIFTYPKILLLGILTNIIFIANILYSFYRRGSDEIAHPFTNYNFALIRVLSIIQVISYAVITGNLLHFKHESRK